MAVYISYPNLKLRHTEVTSRQLHRQEKNKTFKKIENMIQAQVLILLSTALAIQCTEGFGLFEVSEVFVESGSVAVLPCIVEFSSDNSELIWKKITDGEERTVWRRSKSGLEFRAAGKDFRTRCPHPNFGKANYSLHIERARVEDAGMYRCIVDNRNKHFKNVMLRVVQVSFTPAEVVEGENLKLTCSIMPMLNNVITKWELNGSPRTDVQNNAIKVSQRDSGTWGCFIQYNNIQLLVSASLRVQGILDPKECDAVVYAEVGSDVRLPCIFSSGLILQNTSWKKLSNANQRFDLLPSSFKRSFKQQDRSAFIENVQVTDEGKYHCLGELEFRGRKVTLERNIRLVSAQVQSSLSNGRLTLTCYVSDTKSVTDYEWLHITSGANGSQSLTFFHKSSSNVLKISNEKQFPGWVCNFYNKERLLGNATYYPPLMSGLKDDKETGTGSKVAMIIGFSFLIIVVLLILLQIHKNHRRKKMILQCAALETIVHKAANEREFKERNQAREKGANLACGYSPKSARGSSKK